MNSMNTPMLAVHCKRKLILFLGVLFITISYSHGVSTGFLQDEFAFPCIPVTMAVFSTSLLPLPDTSGVCHVTTHGTETTKRRCPYLMRQILLHSSPRKCVRPHLLMCARLDFWYEITVAEQPHSQTNQRKGIIDSYRFLFFLQSWINRKQIAIKCSDL